LSSSFVFDIRPSIVDTFALFLSTYSDICNANFFSSIVQINGGREHGGVACLELCLLLAPVSRRARGSIWLTTFVWHRALQQLCVAVMRVAHSFDAAAGIALRLLLLLLPLVQGVHYDASEDDDVHGPPGPSRIFHLSDQSIASRALLAARRRQAARSFTNVSKFTLRCSDCQAGLVGAVEAQEHAKATGHANFEEYAK